MALNRDFIGRTYPPGKPYEVSRVKISEFADAIGDPNPLYHDREAAKAAGYPDVVAPPTFPMVFTAGGGAVADPELGLDYSMVVHGEQKFEYSRPIHAGDAVVCQTTVSDIRSAGDNELMTIKVDVTTTDGEPVCTAHNTIVERGGASK